jgi:hypothetical protein
MKYYTFKRESNKFDDILKDPNLKKLLGTVINWNGYLMVGIDEYAKSFDATCVYITLKYGDDICPTITKDYAPVMFKDYIPKDKK